MEHKYAVTITLILTGRYTYSRYEVDPVMATAKFELALNSGVLGPIRCTHCSMPCPGIHGNLGE